MYKKIIWLALILFIIGIIVAFYFLKETNCAKENFGDYSNVGMPNGNTLIWAHLNDSINCWGAFVQYYASNATSSCQNFLNTYNNYSTQINNDNSSSTTLNWRNYYNVLTTTTYGNNSLQQWPSNVNSLTESDYQYLYLMQYSEYYVYNTALNPTTPVLTSIPGMYQQNIINIGTVYPNGYDLVVSWPNLVNVVNNSYGQNLPTGDVNNQWINNWLPNPIFNYIINHTPFSMAVAQTGVWNTAFNWSNNNTVWSDLVTYISFWVNVLNNASNAIASRYVPNVCNASSNPIFNNLNSIQNCSLFQDTYQNAINTCNSYKNGANNNSIDDITSVDFNTITANKYSTISGNSELNNFNQITLFLGTDVVNQCMSTGNTCDANSLLDINAIPICFGSNPPTNPSPEINATGAYNNALNAYQNVMDTYINTTSTDISSSELIVLEQGLDSSFSAAIAAPNTYQTVLSNLLSFTSSTSKTFDQNCQPTTRLDASGIYQCFGEGVAGDYTTSPLGELQTSCQQALRVANANQDMADLPTLYGNCSNFFRNNLANTVADVSQNMANLMSYNEQVISNNAYYTEQLNAAKNQTCKQNNPIILPVSNLINNTLTTYNETVGPYLDGLITELTQINSNLPNTISIAPIQLGPPGSSPFVTIDPVNENNAQVLNITVAQGKQGSPGPMGSPGSQGNPGPNGSVGPVGSKGILEQPVQYRSLF
jgi:hypothetical protein